MTVTTPFQGTFNGLTFGAFSDVGLVGIEGLTGQETRSLNIPKSRQNGAWAGLNLLEEKVFTVELEVIAPRVLPFNTVVGQVATAFQPINDPEGELPLEYLLPSWGMSRIVMCRPTNGRLPIDAAYGVQDAKFTIEMSATDPLLYSAELKSASAGLPSPTAGLTFPVTFPVTFGASTGGSLSVTNAGNYITAPIITITGPVQNPTVSFPSSGQYIALNITLGVGDVLVIDMGARTVTLNGTANRYTTIMTGSSWWGIPPGTWSIGVASTDSAPVAALFTVQWRDAWGWAA